MTKDEAMKLIIELEDTAIVCHEYCNGYNRRGKWETKEQREIKAIKAILKHLTTDAITDDEIRTWIN